MNYASIRKYDISNWSGINTTIFFSGCNFECPGCFNKEAQDFNFGKEFDKDAEDMFIQYANDEHVKGVCILGGEPFQQDLDILYRLLFRIVSEVDKPIHVWTGYSFESLFKDSETNRLLHMIDTLVDGKFIEDKKDLSLRFKGSTNQRVIDVQNTIVLGRIIEID